MAIDKSSAKHLASAKRSVLKSRKFLLLLSAAVISITLVSLLVIVPFVWGDSFLTYSFELDYTLRERQLFWRVVYVNGSTIDVVRLGLEMNWTNTYFFPIDVKYNGIMAAMLVYNRSVEDPADVELNGESLVWGGYLGYPWHPGELSGKDYDYYVSRKGLTNCTERVWPGGWYHAEMSEDITPVWRGEDLDGTPVPPGNYSIYCLVYGHTLGPINLTVVSSPNW